MCTSCGGKPHSIRPCQELSKKRTTCEKVGYICRSKPQPNSGKYKKLLLRRRKCFFRASISSIGDGNVSN